MDFAFKKLDLETKLVCLIIFSIGFQQFPVIRIGGSFKIYELLAICLLGVNLFTPTKSRYSSYINLYTFCFFIVSPLLSYISSYIFLDYPSGFYRTYEDTDSFKFNYWIFPGLQLVYMFFNYTAFNSIVKSKKIYDYFTDIIKICIWIGTGIAAYSLFAMFIVDFIAKLPEFLQNKHEYGFRSTGLSQEPSFYVLYQTWVVLMIFYSKNLFSKKLWILLLSLNVVSLLFTFSTTLVALALIILFCFFILKNSFKTKIWLLAVISVTLVGLYLIAISNSNWDYVEFYFINKLTNFFSAPQHTLDSGSFRSYTSRIGTEIFKLHPLTGVGVGNSIYYMYLFEDKMGILIFGERLLPGSFPQNAFSSVLSEQGIIGGIFFVLLLLKSLYLFWSYRNHDNYCRMFFTGFLFNLVTMGTIAPVYSLFLWVFIALGLGYIRNIASQDNHVDEENEKPIQYTTVNHNYILSNG